MKSTRYAAYLAGAYVLLAGAYIILSGYLAAGASHSVEELRRIETIKGVVYVAVTALLIFAGARWAMRRMENDARELMRREQALVANEGRVFAGLTAASIAHDVNNVLTVALADIEMLEEDGRGNEGLTRLHHSMRRMVGLNRRLLGLAQAYVSREGSLLDAREAAREVVAVLRSHQDVRHCRLSCEGEAGLVIAASPVLMHQLVGNLVLNAAQAAGEKGIIEVRVRGEDNSVVIEVHDNGPGVPPERRAELFSALVTTKPDGNGLGLFSVKACATGLGGRVEVLESPLGGALFRIHLPRSSVRAAVTA
ncbi:MAG: HAMP domain-containing histidine kinase [bacterium]|nr:HAMP domain-containing histidine kinase [bacterium]